MDPTRVSCIAGRFSTAVPPGSTIQNNKLKKKKKAPGPLCLAGPCPQVPPLEGTCFLSSGLRLGYSLWALL